MPLDVTCSLVSSVPPIVSHPHLAEGSELEPFERSEEGCEIGQAKETDDRVDGLDLLCLETACSGVLTTLWCDLAIYARDYAVPKSVLRAMVQCSFLAELDRATLWVEDEENPKPLTREGYVRVIARAREFEDARVRNAKYPYRVLNAKWEEMLNKAKSKGKSSNSSMA